MKVKMKSMQSNYTRMGREIPQHEIVVDLVEFYNLNEKVVLPGDIVVEKRSAQQVFNRLAADPYIEISALELTDTEVEADKNAGKGKKETVKKASVKKDVE